MNQPFNFPDGRVANNAEDLLELCEQYPDDATGFLVKQDLEKWLAYIGNYEAAECAANARQIDTGDRQKLDEFLSRYHSLKTQQVVPAAVTKTDIKDNMVPPEEGEPITNIPPAPAETPTAPVKIDSAKLKAPDTKPETVAKKTTETPPAQQSTTPTSPASTKNDSSEKPSFFQVVAKFIVKILYRDKA